MAAKLYYYRLLQNKDGDTFIIVPKADFDKDNKRPNDDLIGLLPKNFSLLGNDTYKFNGPTLTGLCALFKMGTFVHKGDL